MKTGPTHADLVALFAQIDPWTTITATPTGWSVQQRIKLQAPTREAIWRALVPFELLLQRQAVAIEATNTPGGLILEVSQIEPSAWPGSLKEGHQS
jgi:hypothetical protein